MNYSHNNNNKRRKAHKAKGKKVKNKIGFVILRVLIAVVLIGGFAVAGAGIGAYLGIIGKSPTLANIDMLDGSYDSILYDKDGVEYDRLNGGENREYAEFDQIPQFMKDAFVALEDERFYSHNGIDAKGFVRAAYQTIFEDSTQGASTITQQLIKNKRGLKRNTIESKLQEQYLAIKYEEQLEKELGSKKAAKDKILLLYMNMVTLGHGQNGVQAAAKYYFNKDVSELSLAQCAMIAAITQNPTGYSPVRFPEKNRVRQTVALNNMLEFGMITQAQYDEAKAEDVYAEVQQTEVTINSVNSVHSYFTDEVVSQLSEFFQSQGYTGQEASQLIYRGGLSIYTTLDRSAQAIVDEAYQNETLFPTDYELAVSYEVTINNEITRKQRFKVKKGTVKTMQDIEGFVEKAKDELLGTDDVIVDDVVYYSPQPQSSMVIIDYHNGHVIALSGGRGEKQTNRGFNRATDAVRQPGSVFKILASYAPALDMGLITPATSYDDAPFILKGKVWPKNWYASPPYRGYRSVRYAIEQSVNVIAVKNMDAAGIDNCFNYVTQFGIKTLKDTDRGLSMALGGLTTGVTTLEVTSAFGAIANGGMLNEPIFYTKVLNHNGETIIENVQEPKQVLKKTTAFLLTDMMKGVISSGTGGQAAFKSTKMPLAGKTGTTSDNKDLNFLGYSPYYVCGVWLGYDSPKVMSSSITGAKTHMKLWSYVMEQLHQNLEYKDFERPDGITTAQICSVSGKLAVDGVCNADPRGSQVRSELFAAGTVPTTYCDVHMAYSVDTLTGRIPNIYCPPESVVTKVGILRDKSYVSVAGEVSITDGEYEVPQAIMQGLVCTEHDINHQTAPAMPGAIDPLRPGIDMPGMELPTPTPIIATEAPYQALPLLDMTPPPAYTHPAAQAPAKTPSPAPDRTPITIPESTPPPNNSNGPTIDEGGGDRPLVIDNP